jgi:hypothetical protein
MSKRTKILPPPPSNTVAIPVSLFFPEKMGLRLRNCTEI